ncbi:MAG: hypothetical protein V4622_05995 [Bacteroidota bacterium]
MKTLKYISLFLLLQSCASAYHPVYPKNVKHSMHESKDNIDLSYKYGVLGENGNGKYVRRASRKGYQIVAYKVTNNTEDTLIMGKDIVFMNGDKRIMISNDLYASKAVKQYVIGFLPYAAGSYFWVYLGGSSYPTTETKYKVKENYYTTKFPLGLVISLPVMIGNMVVANFSNKAFYDNMKYNDMSGKPIPPKGNIYGLVSFKSKEQFPLTLVKIKQ